MYVRTYTQINSQLIKYTSVGLAHVHTIINCHKNSTYFCTISVHRDHFQYVGIPVI